MSAAFFWFETRHLVAYQLPVYASRLRDDVALINRRFAAKGTGGAFTLRVSPRHFLEKSVPLVYGCF